MLIKRRHIRFASYHSRGLAISLILLAVVLLAAIGVALAIGSRSGFSGTSNQKAKVLANIILSQAAKVEAGYNNMRVVNGWGDRDFGTPELFNPSNQGSMEEPLIPLDAVTDPQNGSANRWLYKPSTVAFKNVGSSNWADTMSLVNIQKNVCAEINRKLFNDPTIYQTATGTVSSWTGLFTGLDLSSDPATDPSGTAPGRVEQCLEMTDGVYVYYRVVHEL